MNDRDGVDSARTRAEPGAMEASIATEEPAEDRWGVAMAAAQTGDEGAYRSLLEELVPVIRRQVRSRIYEPADAEDVVQNALISIHRGRHTYRPERRFEPWMRTVVRHCVIDWFRERGRRGQRELAVESPELFAEPTAPIEPGAERLSPPLAEALQQLPQKQREAVELIHIQGLTVAEAAAKVGVSQGALKVRAHRGYRALRQRLGSAELARGEA